MTNNRKIELLEELVGLLNTMLYMQEHSDAMRDTNRIVEIESELASLKDKGEKPNITKSRCTLSDCVYPDKSCPWCKYYNDKEIIEEKPSQPIEAEKEVSDYQSGIITVKERTIKMLNLGDNQNSVHDAPIMDRYQNEAIRFLAEQIDILHKLRYKSHRDNLIKKG